MKNNKIVDVEIDYVDDFLWQQIYYGDNYSFLK